MLRCCVFLFSLLLSASLHAAVFTVAQDGSGTHSSIQAAVNAAIATGGANDVRVAAGTWLERVVVDSSVTGNLNVAGGWTHGFRVRSFDESRTIVDGSGVGPVLFIRTNKGRVFVTGFTFTGADSLTPDP